MKQWFRSRWLWLALFLTILPLGGLLFLQQDTVNVMHPALDKLSAVPISERWSHPEMLNIRELGVKALPPLRRVLREKDNPTTRVLLWIRAKWPAATRLYSNFPDPAKLTERRWAACQVIQTLGPAARTVTPEVINILKSKDLQDVNAAAMALWAIGIDACICDQLNTLVETEKGLSYSALAVVVGALGNVKPPSEHTLKVLVAALSDPSPYVQYLAALSLSRLGVSTPEIISALKSVQSAMTKDLAVVASSAALWELERDIGLVLPPVFAVLENLLGTRLVPIPGGGSGGQAATAADQSYLAACELFQKLDLREPEKSKALALLDAWGNKSERIFIRMLLLPAMMNLGFPKEKCVKVCQTGLNQSEDYYRLQAARLLTLVSEKHSVDAINLDALIHDADVGVRIYATKIHWRKNRQAQVVVPVLIESLDRSKHQSYYYAETQPVALAVLSDIGTEARTAIGTLEKILNDPNPAIVKLASEALAKIQRPSDTTKASAP
jgi:HEAT repeat protein